MATFYRCNRCGNLVYSIKDSGVRMVCCGEQMEKLVAGSVDASLEKHIPQFDIKDKKIVVNIGSIKHPMQQEHYIEWVCLETNNKVQFKHLKPNEEPCATFILDENEKVLNVYCYCNLHGLWQNKNN